MQYRLLRKIGEGGFGEVFEATDPSGKRYAVKIAKRSVQGSQERLLQQFRCLATSHHRRIVKVYDFDPLAEHGTMMVTEFFDGEDLKTYVSRRGAEDLPKIVAMVLDGLRYLHNLGRIHGDMKPQSILVSKRNGYLDVRLIDAGFSRESTKGLPRIRGTPLYMAPEIISDGEAEARSDLYSLGITLIEVLTGKVPFEGKPLDEVLATHIDGSIDLSEILCGSNHIWTDFIVGLTRRNRYERFSDVSGAGLELERIFASPNLFAGNISLAQCSDLVGRCEELNRLSSKLTLPTEGVIAVDGQPGSGVTRFLCEIANVALEKGLRVERFSCGSGSTFGKSLISKAKQIDPSFTSIESEKKVSGRDYLSDVIRAVECILSDRRIHVFLIDDADLLDSSDTDLIRFVSGQFSENLIVICGSHGRHDAFSSRRHSVFDRIHLRPLNMDETESMVTSLLSTSNVPARLIESIHSLAKGNPKHIDETVRHLFGIGSIRFTFSDGSLIVAWDDNIDVPNGVGFLWEAISDLKDEARQLLAAMSVSGTGFSSDEAKQLIGEAWSSVLDDLRQKGLVKGGCEIGSIEPVYHGNISKIFDLFGKDVVIDVSHRLASIFEGQGEAGGLYKAGLIYSAIGQKEAALRRLVEAGDMLQDTSRATAYDAYQHALLCTDDDKIRQELCEKLGDISLAYDDLNGAFKNLSMAKQRPSARRKLARILGLKGDYDQAIGLLEECKSSALSSGDKVEFGRILTDLGYIMVLAARVSEGIYILREAYRVFVSLSMHCDAGRALNRIGIAYDRQSNFPSAIEAYRLSRKHYELGGDYKNAALRSISEALCLRRTMEFGKAKKLIESATKVLDGLRSPHGLAGCHHALAMVLMDLGELHQAAHYAEKALNLNRILGTLVGEVAAGTLLAGIALEQGNWVIARKMLENFLSENYNPTKYHRMIILRYLARSATLMGDFEEAIDFTDKSHDLACKVGDEEGKGQALMEKARALIAKGENRQAVETAQEAVFLLRSSSSPLYANRVSLLLAEALMGCGEIDRALSEIENARKAFQNLPNSICFGRLNQLQGRAFLAMGDSTTFWSKLNLATEIFRKSGARYDLARALLEGGKVCLEQGNLVKARNYLSESSRIFDNLHIEWMKKEAMVAMGEVFESQFESNAIAALGRISAALNSSRDITSVLNTAMDLAIEYLGAERGVLFLVDEESRDLSPVVQRKMEKQSIEDALDISSSIVERVRSTGECVISSDALSDPRFESSESVYMYNIRGVMAVPLRVDGRLIGIIYLDSRTAPYELHSTNRTFIEVFANQIALAINNARLFTRLHTDFLDLKVRAGERYSYKNIIGPGARMQEVFRQVEKAARSKISVLLVGESGTGKELIAGLIHQLSPRCDKPYIIVNLGAIAKDLIESELFGIEGRVATGVAARVGVFERANGGTIFLDEIGDMPKAMQGKILRVLSEHEFNRVGGAKTIKLDVRVLCATNRDIRAMTREGLFREDLYYRLNGMQIQLPPLRDRIEDLPALVEHFVAKYCAQNGKPHMRVSSDVLNVLSRYRWPGNVRELEKCLEYAVVIADGDQIGPEHLPREIIESLQLEHKIGIGFHRDLEKVLKNVERKMIIDALTKTDYVQTKAAALLGIHESTLRKKMKAHGIKKGSFDSGQWRSRA
ncbi:MAG: sigma 54-interacting transcriptional regulator [bacterium]